MATNGAKQVLLSGLVDPIPQTNKAFAPNQRRFFNVETSSLVAGFIPLNFGSNGSLARPKSILGKLHPSVKNLAVCLAVYLCAGTLCFYFVLDDIKGKKSNPIIDAVYLCVVTMTTVGYGDLVPDSTFVKVLCCVFVFIGMGLVGLIMSKVADYLVEKQEILLVKALSKPQFKPMKEIESKRLRYKCFLAMGILSVFMMVGTMFLYTIEDLDMIDAFYCVCTTMTTLGYGDKSFSTEGGRAFAIFWILISTLGLGQFFLYVAELFTESRQRALVYWILTKGITNFDLKAADIDNGVTKAAEFAVNKLKEMGKIGQEDISRLMKEFEDLDVHKSGFLSASDLVFAQTTQAKR